MFGGLAVKGGDAKEDEAGSGFSFLQTTGATTAAASTDQQPAAAAEVEQQQQQQQQQQQPSMSLGTSGGSAFGFLSSGGSTENKNADTTNNNPAQAPPYTMFAGLNNSNTPAPAAATYSSDSPQSNVVTEEPPPPSGSGFSFMSLSTTTSAAPTQSTESNNYGVEESASNNVSTAGSSFSFMSSMNNGEQKADTYSTHGVVSIVGEESSVAAAPSSGFSFLGSSGTNAPPPPPTDSPSFIPQGEPSSPSQGGSSMFVGLNTTESLNLNTTAAPPPPPAAAAADSDLLSMSSPSLPAASGVSWGAPPGVGGAKKIVKKKRGKRVGVGSATVVQTQPPQQPVLATESNYVHNVGGMNSIPAPEPSSFQPPPPTDTSPYAPAMSPPMRVKAEMATQNAEEFIKEKQRSAIAMAAERAMNEKATSSSQNGSSGSGSGGGGGWKIATAAETPTLSPRDSEYQAAKAAAEEARNLSASKLGTASSKSLFSGVSGFFGRKSPNTQPPQQPVLATESNYVHNVGGMNSIPAPEPSSFQPPPPTDTSPYAPAMSPPMRVKAEMATQNAEEFIKEKQRSAIAMAAERAMNEKATSSSQNGSSGSGSGGGGGWKIATAAETPTLSPRDSEYQAAKAAAEEARNLSASKLGTASSKSLFSGVSGFFGRKSPNTSSNDAASVASYSSHGGVLNNVLDPVRRTNSNPSASSLSPTKEGEEHRPSTDPIQRENDEAKRAAAERDMAMFRESQMQEQERLQRVVEAKRQRKDEEDKKRLEQERLRQLEEEAKRRSPKEKMQAALDHFADITRRSTDYVTQLRAKRTELVKERMEAEKTERFAVQQISYAEAQQTQAAEDEDFEAADRLASDIDRHTLEKNKQTEIVKNIDEAISQIEKQREVASKAVVACFSGINSKLKELQADVDDRKKKDGVLNQFAKTSKRLSSETERLSNDLKHIERDETVLADEQKELESQITDETKEFDEKRVEASEKLEVVDKEIEDLRKKLAEAEEKAATLNKEISSYKDSIQSVRTKYSRQSGRLEKKERSVKESRAEWQVEQESVEKAKAAHESVVAAHSEDMLTREKLIEEIKVEISVALDFEDIVSSAFDATEFIGDGNQAFDSDVLKYEAAVDEANNNVISAESKVQNLQDEVSAFDVRVPILEAEKKVAAAKRDFKAAGKASKEIKDALARKEQCEAELSGEAMERKQASREELQKVALLLEEKKSIAAEKGKEVGVKRMETLRERIAHLQSVVKELGADSGDSDSINVACVGAFVIDSQINVLETEGKALGEKYGGWASDVAEDASNAAEEANEEDNAPSDTVIDDDTLEEYAILSAEIEELETKILQAAAEEDYDTARELEEQAECLRSKINSLGYLPDKMALALKNKGGDEESPNCILDESILDKYASLKAQVAQLEADIETAVAAENFDDAAELEENVQVSKSEIESLGFSVNDLEEALINGLKIDEDEAETDTSACNDEVADEVSRKLSDDVDVVEKEANTKENETPNGSETLIDANGNDAKVAQNSTECD